MYKMNRIRCDIMADSFTRHTANDAVTIVRYYDVTPIVSVGADATDLHKERCEIIEKYNVLNVIKFSFDILSRAHFFLSFRCGKGLLELPVSYRISPPPPEKKPSSNIEEKKEAKYCRNKK